jgi:hypothetical protein
MKARIFNCLKRNISRKEKRRLSDDIELLLAEIIKLSKLSPEIFRKLKLHASSLPEESFVVNMFNGLISIIALLLTAMALLGSWSETPFPTSLIPELNKYVIWIILLLGIVALLFFATMVHIIFTDMERTFRQKFLIAINEIERNEPVIVHLSEAQYQALLASSSHQRFGSQFGRPESHVPNGRWRP